MDEPQNLSGLTAASGLNGFNFGYNVVVYPSERHVRQDQSGKNEELASDMQHVLQTLTEMDERLQKIESSNEQGNWTKIVSCF